MFNVYCILYFQFTYDVQFESILMFLCCLVSVSRLQNVQYFLTLLWHLPCIFARRVRMARIGRTESRGSHNFREFNVWRTFAIQRIERIMVDRRDRIIKKSYINPAKINVAVSRFCVFLIKASHFWGFTFGFLLICAYSFTHSSNTPIFYSTRY